MFEASFLKIKAGNKRLAYVYKRFQTFNSRLFGASM